MTSRPAMALLLLLAGCSTQHATGPDAGSGPVNVLMIADGDLAGLRALEAHLVDSGHYTLTRRDTSRLASSGDLGGFDLLVIAGDAAKAGASAPKAREAGKPMLVLEQGGFAWSKALGLVTDASCSDERTESLEALQRVAHDAAWYLGKRIPIYDGARDVCLFDAAHLASPASTLLYGNASDGRAALLYDVDERIAATSAADADRYAADGWLLLDFVLASLVSPAPAADDPWKLPAALGTSGLLEYVRRVQADPSSFDEASVRERVFDLLLWNRLMPLADWVTGEISKALPGFALGAGPDLAPPAYPHHPRCGYPNQLWFLGEHFADAAGGKSCTEPYFPDDPSTWPKDIDPDAGIAPYGGPVWNSAYVGGADLGASVTLGKRTFFYFGDTWARREDGSSAHEESNPKWCGDPIPGFACDPGAVRNDAIGVSVDDTPEDGVDLTVITRLTADPAQEVTFQGLGLPGVHASNPEPGLWDDTNDYLPVPEPRFTTTSGATAVDVPFEVRRSGGAHAETVFVPMVVLFYTTASAPPWMEWWKDALAGTPYEGMRGFNSAELCEPPGTDDCNAAAIRHAPRSFAACSFDGIDFFNCYGGARGPFAPFSADRFEWTDCAGRKAVYDADRVGRFIRVSPLFVPAAELDALCHGTAQKPATAPQSLLCALHGKGAKTGGVLLFGTGRPGSESPLFLAWMKPEELGRLEGGKPRVSYFTGKTDGDPAAAWSGAERDAAPLPLAEWAGNLPCDGWDEISRGCDAQFPPENCSAEPGKPTFGAFPISTKLVTEGPAAADGPQAPLILFLYTLPDGANYRAAPLSAPWDLGAMRDLDAASNADPLARVDGYGLFLIDRPGYVSYANDELGFSHVVSVWNEESFSDHKAKGPYGIYTKRTSIPWPPAP
ncbi:MAG: hypothetical protein PHU25_10905 [Deltaproteobacteria bacterium]|nr:hypothetical protein [Deltaproteobacteria bacterium]